MHDDRNNDCPLNDPETMTHPATRGLPCICDGRKMVTGHMDGDGATFLIAEASPCVGNLAVAVYVGGFGGPMLGTFATHQHATAFVADLNAVFVKHGGEPLPISDD